MSRSVSSTFKQAIYASETDEAFLVLLTIDHETLENPIRVTSGSIDVVSNGETFVPFPFNLSLPDESSDAAPRARLAIDNIDRQIVLSVRSITTAPTVKMEVILASDPDVIEASFPDFKLENISYDAYTVSGDLVLEEFVTEPFPAGIFNPAEFRGLF